MRTPHSTLYRYSAEAVSQANRLPVGTVSESAHKNGMTSGEPLTIAMDCLLKYAEAYQVRFESTLSDDYVLGPSWLEAAKGVRELLNGNGAVANMRDISTDSKDNGCIESMFWDALRIAGYEEKDI